MNCPACGAPVADDQARFCARCGRPLGGVRETGGRLDRDADPLENAGSSSAPRESLEEMDARGGSHETPQEMVRGLLLAVRGSVTAGEWGPAALAAGLGFLAVLGVGAAFIGVLKLYDPTFGAGRSGLWVVIRIVISGLASLGIPVEQVGAEGVVVPLGALLFVGWVLVWAVRNVVDKSSASSVRARVVLGAKTAIPFALMAFLGAVIFRIRENVEVGANPAAALLIAGVWGALFGVAGAAIPKRGLRPLLSTSADVGRYRSLFEGVRCGAIMATAGAVLTGAALLIFLVVDLATGSEIDLSLGDAVALLFLLVVFAPNLIFGLLAFSTGASVDFVAQTLDVGVQREFSLLGWDGSAPEWWWYPLLFIPPAVCLLGGYVARRRTSDPGRMMEVLAIAACSFGVIVGLLALLGGLSLDRVFLGAGNLLVLRADPGASLFLGVLWAAGAGFLGWKLAGASSVGAAR